MAACEVNARIERFVGDTSPVVGTLYIDGELLIPTGTVKMKIYAIDTSDFLQPPLQEIIGTVDPNGKVTFDMSTIATLPAGAYPYRITVEDTYQTTFVSDVMVLK